MKKKKPFDRRAHLTPGKTVNNKNERCEDNRKVIIKEFVNRLLQWQTVNRVQRT